MILGGVVSDRSSTEDFVGRSAELATFEQAILDPRNGLPSVLLVGGDAGIGKSTIVRQGASRAGLALYLGRSTHIGGDTIPLAPVADLVRQVRRSRPDLFDESSAPGPLRLWFTPRSVDAETSTSDQGGLFVAVLDLIGHLASDDAVLVGFEDLHWADSATWDLLDYLARNLIDERVVLVGTYRADEVGVRSSQRGRLAELRRLPATRHLHLAGLDRDDIAARVSALIGEPAPTVLVDQIVSRGQGNPFFTNELVAAHLAGETIPIVLSDLISTEIAALDETARHVLGVVAAIGRDTSHELLADTVPQSDAQLEAAVRTAIDARLLEVDHDAYRFRHPLIGEVVYADLLPPQRQRLHRRLAEVLGRQPADVLRRPDRAGELALHLDRSGDVDGAFTALLAAADAAETVAPGAAFTHLTRALELWDAAGERAATASRTERLWQAAELATSTVGNARAIELARAAFELGPPALGAAWGHERLGRYLWASGQLDQSRTEFAHAAELLADKDPAAALVWAGLGQAELMSGRYEKAELWCERVFNAVRSPDEDPVAWGMARRVLGIVRSNQGDPDEAVELCRESVAAANGAQARAFASVYLCVALIDAGDHLAAVNVALDAIAEAQLTGLHGFDCYFDSLAAEALTRLGRWPDAETVLARQPVAGTFPAGLVRFARARALLAARLGHTEEALEHLAAAHAQPVDGWHQTVVDATTADVHLALGNWDEAAEAADRGWASTATTSPLWAARFAMLSVAAGVELTLDAHARSEPVDLAETVTSFERRIAAARSLAEACPHGPQRDTEAHLAHATACLTRLDASDADAWTAAATRWNDLGDQWATATALLREAEAAALAGAADRAASSLRHAHAIAHELGAAPLLADLEALSRRTRISIDAPARVTLDGGSVERLGLTTREAEVLSLVAAGRTNRQIGDELFVSVKTASVHVSNILRKLGVNSRVDAAAVAQRLGID